MDKFWEHFDALVAKMTTLAPVAYNKMIMVTYYGCLGTVISAAIAFVVGLGLLGVSYKCFQGFNKAGYYEQDPWGWAMVIFGVVGACTTVISLCFGLLDQWAWIGIFNPEAAMIHDLITKAAS